ncbi:HEAT repeat domain-containing protein [Microcoleus sp. EPA2]|uniref:HEAT repeat domain-containing protein n=1 Tax=Microcoleus sp. EPA2 TaxID=2841654 RepID=UPI00312B39C3
MSEQNEFTESKTRTIQLICHILQNDPSSLVRTNAAEALAKMGADSKEAIATLYQAALEDSDPSVRASAVTALGEIYRNAIIFNVLNQAINTMSERKVQMNFNAPVTGAAGNVEGDFINNPPQNLVDAAAEIQQLLNQIAQNPTVPESVVAEAIHHEIKENLTLKQRLRSALKAGGIEALKAIFNHPLVSVPIETIKGWIEAE